ncbi:MAG: histidine kinase [Ferruginibacter sp.]
MYGYSNRSLFKIADLFSQKVLKSVLCFLLLTAGFISFAQEKTEGLPLEQVTQINRQLRVRASMIDSLKIILLTVKDTSRVNCLNKLSPLYLLINTDTAYKYASEAYIESEKNNFFKGMGDAILNMEGIATIKGDWITSEKYCRQAIRLYDRARALNKVNESYIRLGYSLFCESNYTEARAMYEKAALYFFNLNDNKKQALIFRFIGKTYYEQGYYEKAFEYFLNARNLGSKTKYTPATGSVSGLMATNLHIGKIYKDAGDYKTAMVYYRKVAQNAKQNEMPENYNALMGEMYFLENKWDSALHYYNLVAYCLRISIPDSLARKKVTIQFHNINVAEAYLLKKDFEKALEYLFEALTEFKNGNRKDQMKVLTIICKAYEEQKKFAISFNYANQLLGMARHSGARPYIRDAYNSIWKTYDQQGKTDSAYKYHLLYVSMKDTLAKDEQLRNMAIAEMEMEEGQQQARIAMLGMENKIKQGQLKKEVLLKRILAGGILVLLILSGIVFRNITLKRKNEANRCSLAENELQLQKLESNKTRSELQQQAIELEIRALRAQMNPHFIFNSLNSINRFILQNNKLQASQYLTKFSKLIRLILQNSQAALIPLESEIESLQLYLELEALRFDHHFEFTISVENDLDIAALKLPPLIIQPYAENAIWHGLMHKEEKGKLEIKFYQREDFLCCCITDDGIGRTKAAALKSKSGSTHKSMGMRITADRIAMLKQKKQLDNCIKITDLVLDDGSPGGTEVVLTIPAQYD